MIKLKDLLTERFDDSKIFSNALVKKVASDIQKMFPKSERDTKVEYKEFRFVGGDGGFNFSWEHGNRWYGSYHFSVRTNKTEVKTTYDNVASKKTFGQETTGDKFTKDVKSYKDLNDKILKGHFKMIKAVIAKNEKDAHKEFEKDRDAQAAYYGSKAQTGRIGYGLSSQPRR